MKVNKNEIVIEDPSVQIDENATIIFGFAGVGLIGPIITNTLIDQIEDLKQIGFVTSTELPPIAVFYDGVLKHPFRLYYSKEKNLIVGICEVPFETNSAYDGLSELMCKWALSEDVKAKEFLIFQGILKREMIDEHHVYYAAEEHKVEFLENFDIQKLKQGIIYGAEATFLNRALSNKIDAFALFTEVTRYPTPEGAAAIIEKMNQIFNLNIDTTKLIEEGKKIKNKMLEMAEKAQEYQRKQLRGTKHPREEYTQYFQ
jgi:uncharacterized protein